MRYVVEQDSSLFPSFAGYADLMSILCLIFIVGVAVATDQTELNLSSIENLRNENEQLRKENERLRAEAPEVPKKIIIPNEVDGRVFFQTCEAIIQAEFLPQLDSMINQIRPELESGRFNFIEVDGHTDKQQIANCDYESNWELGAARAIAVVKYLESKGFDARTLSAVSRAEFAPALEGDDEETFSENRRIEIIMLRK